MDVFNAIFDTPLPRIVFQVKINDSSAVLERSMAVAGELFNVASDVDKAIYKFYITRSEVSAARFIFFPHSPINCGICVVVPLSKGTDACFDLCRFDAGWKRNVSAVQICLHMLVPA